MAIPFQQYDAPAWGGQAITPADGLVLNTNRGTPFRGLYVGGAGNVQVRMLDGSTQVFAGVLAGTTLAIQYDKVFATNTTATNLVGLY